MTTTAVEPQIVIDDEFRDLVPALQADERQQLEANLLRDGCRDPLVVWDTHDGPVLLDGHNRFEICQEHGIDFTTTTQPIETRAEAVAWIVDHQTGRRNLNPYQRTRLALTKKDALAQLAKERQREGGGSGPSGKQKSAEPGQTRDELAKIAGVSHDTVSRVQAIQDRAPKQVKNRLERGEMSINEAFKVVKRADRYAERDRMREEAVVEFPEGGGIITGDLNILHDHLADDSVDLFLTDPPWTDDGVEAGVYETYVVRRACRSTVRP